MFFGTLILTGVTRYKVPEGVYNDLASIQGTIKGRAVVVSVFGIDTGAQDRTRTLPCGTTSQLLSSDKYFMKPLRALFTNSYKGAHTHTAHWPRIGFVSAVLHS
jgi:hypothetical protein